MNPSTRRNKHAVKFAWRRTNKNQRVIATYFVQYFHYFGQLIVDEFLDQHFLCHVGQSRLRTKQRPVSLAAFDLIHGHRAQQAVLKGDRTRVPVLTALVPKSEAFWHRLDKVHVGCHTQVGLVLRSSLRWFGAPTVACAK